MSTFWVIESDTRGMYIGLGDTATKDHVPKFRTTIKRSDGKRFYTYQAAHTELGVLIKEHKLRTLSIYGPMFDSTEAHPEAEARSFYLAVREDGQVFCGFHWFGGMKPIWAVPALGIRPVLLSTDDLKETTKDLPDKLHFVPVSIPLHPFGEPPCPTKKKT